MKKNFIYAVVVLIAFLASGCVTEGQQGPAGPAGIDGTNGTNGTDGKDGVDGKDGINGINGTNGVDGVNGTNGVDGVNGTNGTNGTDGTNGVDGKDGVDGANGTDGTNGTNGTNAILSSGKIGTVVEGKTYSACHYDYLLLSNSWLILRRQPSTTAEAQNGTSGILLWDIPQATFSVVATSIKVKNVVTSQSSCLISFDLNAGTLNYTVSGNTDGKGGETGVINLF